MLSDEGFSMLEAYHKASDCDAIALNHINRFNVLEGFQNIFPISFVFFSIIFDSVES
jgi:hypothetical protein